MKHIAPLLLVLVLVTTVVSAGNETNTISLLIDKPDKWYVGKNKLVTVQVQTDIPINVLMTLYTADSPVNKEVYVYRHKNITKSFSQNMQVPTAFGVGLYQLEVKRLTEPTESIYETIKVTREPFYKRFWNGFKNIMSAIKDIMIGEDV